ncbi:MAG: diaminopimelate epimerase [Methanomassiliicoccales archaeon]|jgi:diaminopimelate epimerase
MFWKYHGTGNDFVLFENFKLDAADDPETVRRLCDRRFGVGADGILYINPAEDADATMRIINADGSEAEMCGNGIRCVAKHLYDFSIVRKRKMTIRTLAGLKKIECKVEKGEVKEVGVNMGAASLECQDVPMKCPGRFIDRTIDIGGTTIRGTAVSMGNPHFVTFQKFTKKMMSELGPKIEVHYLFPKRTNTEFARLVGERLDVVVHERGAGWTLACGTGTCASAVAAAVNGLISYDEDVEVRLPGGSLWVRVAGDLSCVFMKGPATRVFKGEMETG